MKKNLITILSLALVFITTSCSLDPTLADDESVEIRDAENMRQLIDGSYVRMAHYEYLGRNAILAGDLRTDNMFSNGQSNRFVRWSNMNILDTDNQVAEVMRRAYAATANASILINADVADLPGAEAEKNQVLGEAHAIRAHVHFDLLRLYGQKYSEGNDLGISYVKEFKGPKNIERGSIESNYEDLKDDIANAISYFNEAEGSEYYSDKTNYTLDAVYALQSRIGIYMKDYEYAYEGSSKIVDEYTITPEADFVEMWEQQTPPAGSIFELYQNTSTNNQGNEGLASIFRGNAYGDVVAFDNLIEDAEFDDNDIRASEDMIAVSNGALRNIGKYPAMGEEMGSDNIKVFRIEEVVLNHAEALANGAGSGDALAYLNSIPENRGASTYSDASMENIIKERRKELLFEGFRFFDLARMGMDIRDMGEPINNHGHIEAGSYKFAFPIPEREINSNRDAVQNPGY